MGSPTGLLSGEYEILAGEDVEFGRRLSDVKVTSEVTLARRRCSVVL